MAKYSFYIHTSNINCAFILHEAPGWQLVAMNGEREMTMFSKSELWFIKYLRVEMIKKTGTQWTR